MVLKNSSFTLQSVHNNRPFLADLSYVEDGKPKPIVIFIHGFKGFKDWGPFPLMANYFARAGLAFLKFNFSHNGTTVENPLEFVDLDTFAQDNHSIQLDDLDCLLNFVEETHGKEIDSTRIFLVGHSRGGSIAVLKAAEDDRVKKIVTWAAVADLTGGYSQGDLQTWKEVGYRTILNTRTQQEMRVNYQYYEDLLQHSSRLNVLEAAARIRQPLLILHGNDDKTVPLSQSDILHKKAKNGPQVTFPNANHTFGGSHPWTSEELPEDFKKACDWTLRFLTSQRVLKAPSNY